MLIFGWIRKSSKPASGWVVLALGLTMLGMAGGITVANGVQLDDIAAKHAAPDHGDAGHGDAAHADPHAVHAPGEPAADDHAADADGEAALPEGEHAPAEEPAEAAAPPAVAAGGSRAVNEGNFFSIYFAMTGVHALHILAGIGAISWIIARIARGDFGPERYGPVEYVGLYWHLVDLVWIYLFPLLYLIH